MTLVNYSGSISSGGFIQTTTANETFYFYNSTDSTRRVTCRQFVVESDDLPLTFSINDELTIHSLLEYEMLGFDGMEVYSVTIHQAGVKVRYTGQF